MGQDIFIPVILSGGTGSRLWPVSREAHPKPFIQLPDGQSLLQKTLLRALSLPNVPEILTITNKEYYLKSKAEYEKACSDKRIAYQFLLEPCARNTAPAIALAALKVLKDYGPDAVLLVLPSDHLIENIDSLKQDAERAFLLARQNKLVTFGITPTRPETGFGYIECGEAYSSPEKCYAVKRFVEKPNLELAEEYIQSKHYLWNSGMFCFKAGTLANEFLAHAKTLFTMATTCFEASEQTKNAVIQFDPSTFAELENISIDYALMEKSNAIAVVACDFAWHDIGSWDAYKKIHPADSDGNTVIGEAILLDSKDNFIQSENRVIAGIGINNLAIIDTTDALLISHRDKTQEVKHIVQTLKEKSHASYLTHQTVIRPWGLYTVLEEGPSFKIKRIVVKAGESLSLQMHRHRSEHWVVVEGCAKVINGEKDYILHTNESTFIPMGTPHRLSNPGTVDLKIIEVQTGAYLGEDDIIRLEDTYGRIQ